MFPPGMVEAGDDVALTVRAFFKSRSPPLTNARFLVFGLAEQVHRSVSTPFSSNAMYDAEGRPGVLTIRTVRQCRIENRSAEKD